MANLTLFNNSTQLGPPIPIVPNPSLADLTSENQFTYTGALGPVTNIVITPTNNGFTALSFDNLTITAAPTVGAVPAASPLTLAITAICLAGLTLLLLRKQARRVGRLSWKGVLEGWAGPPCAHFPPVC